MDTQQFLQADFQPRQKDVPVPELANWFDEGDKPLWTVRGLTGAELGWAKQARSELQMENRRALLTALHGEGDRAAELRKALGLDKDAVPEEISFRIDLLSIGSVSPELGDEGREVAVKLSEAYPITFSRLTDEILNLTGEGADPGKRKPSGKTRG